MGLGGLHGGALAEALVPGEEARKILPERAQGRAKFQPAQGDPGAHLRQIDLLREGGDLGLQGGEPLPRLLRLAVEPGGPVQLGGAAGALVEDQDRRVEDAVAEGLLPEDAPPRRARGRGEGGARDGLEVLADHRRVVERRSVVQEQRRDLVERVAPGERRVRLGRRRAEEDRLDAIRQAQLVGDDQHLADEGRGGGEVELQGALTGWSATRWPGCRPAGSRPRWGSRSCRPG